jgi:hypothetical protein
MPSLDSDIIIAEFENKEFGISPYQNLEDFVIELYSDQGPSGPTGPKGDKGEPGDVGGSLPWANVTGKPDLIEGSEIIDGGNF